MSNTSSTSIYVAPFTLQFTLASDSDSGIALCKPRLYALSTFSLYEQSHFICIADVRVTHSVAYRCTIYTLFYKMVKRISTCLIFVTLRNELESQIFHPEEAFRS